jgi:membrane fusion protein, multidrug efflux system
MRKIDRRIVIVATFIFIVVLAFGLMKYLISLKEDPPTRPPGDKRRLVKVDAVKYSTVWSPVSAPGRLLSVSEVDLVAEASGKIETQKIELKKGARFRKGDILFTIYTTEFELSLKARKSQFLNMLANLLPDVSIDFQDHEQAFRQFFSSIDLDKPMPAFPEVKNDKLRIFLASRNVLAEFLNIQKDELQLSRHTIRAPFDGTYKEVYMEAGAYTNTGGRVAKAIRTDVLELEVPLERIDAEWVKIGDKVVVRSDRSQERWNGTVIRKNQFIDPNTQSQGIFIRLSNNNHVPLLPGEFLHAEFHGHPISGVMEMPRNAVFNNNEVFVVVNERLEKRSIKVIKLNERTLLFNGIDEGAMMVMQPLINVLEGTPVSTDNNPPAQEQKRGKPRQS